MSTSTRLPAFTAPSPSAFSSTSIGTSRVNFTGGRLFFPRCPRMGFVKRESFTNSTKPICAESYPSLVCSLCCVTTHGPACRTVAGRTSPFESKSCVIPTFFPRIPATFAISLFLCGAGALARVPFQRGLSYWLGSFGLAPSLVCVACIPFKSFGFVFADDRRLFMFFPERLDLHIHSGGEIKLHQRIHGLRRRIENVQQALVRADLELLARFLVHVRRTQHCVLVLHRRQRNRTGDLCPGAFGRSDDFRRGLIEHAIIVCLEPDANF